MEGYDFFGNLFKKVGEFSAETWAVLAALVLLAAALIVTGRKRKQWTAKTLACAALSIALSFILGAIRLYRMPQGGSVPPAGMLPMMLFSYAFGVGPGLLAGLAYGLLDFLQGGYILTPVQFVLDYVVAYAMTGFAGLFGKSKLNERVGFGLGVVVASALRLACSVLSGVVFFAEYAEGSGYSPLVYSIVYNGGYMLPNALICLVLGVIVEPRLVKTLRKS